MLLNLATDSPEMDASPATARAPVPRISVVMTTYNGARFLAEQIDSILRQTIDDFELIVADDCSTDTTPSLLHAYAERDPRVRLVLNENNVGLSRNLENVLRLARGHFVAISDQDDVWHPDKLERLLEGIGDHSAAYCDSLLVDAAGQSLGVTLLQRMRLTSPPRDGGAVALLRKNCVSGHALLFRRELLDLALPFDPRLMFDQQLGFFAAINNGLVYVNRPLVHHRIHGGNQTNGSLVLERLESRAARRANRLHRYRKRRAELVERFEGCRTLIANLNVSGDTDHVARTAAILEKIATRMRRFDRTFFDVPLFFLLWSMRKQMFYAGEDKGLHLCMKYAKGARYYALAARARGLSPCA